MIELARTVPCETYDDYPFLGRFTLRTEGKTCAIGIIKRAIAEARDAGHLQRENFSCEISVVQGAGSFVCGEETALINSIEGKRGMPRPRPPFPAVKGLFDHPTVINNVETLVYTAMIINMGVKEFKQLGTNDSRGSKVFSVSGDTPKAGIHELELGLNVADFIEVVLVAGGGAGGLWSGGDYFGGGGGAVVPHWPHDCQRLDLALWATSRS